MIELIAIIGLTFYLLHLIDMAELEVGPEREEREDEWYEA